jgi:hypothetical protein
VRRVYSKDTDETDIRFYSSYSLVVDAFYAFRTRNCTVSGDDRPCAEIFWSGQWELLDNSNSADCRGAQGGARCQAEEFTEVYSEQEADPHPNLSGASQNNRIDWRNTQVRTDSAVWIPWTVGSTQAAFNTYATCAINNYYRFYARESNC